MTSTAYSNPLEKLNFNDLTQNSKYFVKELVEPNGEGVKYIRVFNPNYESTGNEPEYQQTSYVNPNNPTDNGLYYLTYDSNGNYRGRKFVENSKYFQVEQPAEKETTTLLTTKSTNKFFKNQYFIIITSGIAFLLIIALLVIIIVLINKNKK